MSLLQILSLAILSLAIPSRSKSLETPQWRVSSFNETCPVPDWTVEGFNVTYGGDNTPGTASFTLVNTLTNNSEALLCALRFNSLCEMYGTPNDKDLTVLVQLNLETAYITANHTWTCSSVANRTDHLEYAVGMAALALTCPEDYAENMTCTGDTGLIKGSIVTE